MVSEVGSTLQAVADRTCGRSGVLQLSQAGVIEDRGCKCRGHGRTPGDGSARLQLPTACTPSTPTGDLSVLAGGWRPAVLPSGLTREEDAKRL